MMANDCAIVESSAAAAVMNDVLLTRYKSKDKRVSQKF